MTELEKRLKKGLLSYQVNDFFGWTDIRILNANPKNVKELIDLLKQLINENK